MKKCYHPNSLTEGYILFDSLVAVIIIAVFIISLTGLYTSIIKISVKRESAYYEFIATNNDLIDSGKFIYNEE